MSVSLKTVENGTKRIQDRVLSRLASFPAFAKRNLYPIYQKIQMDRWESENASEGNTWKALNPSYAKWKKKRYSDSPGGGTKMLIASGRLYGGVLGLGEFASEYHRVMVTPTEFMVATTLSYAGYVNESRPFMSNKSFSQKSMDLFRGQITQWMAAAMRK